MTEQRDLTETPRTSWPRIVLAFVVIQLLTSFRPGDHTEYSWAESFWWISPDALIVLCIAALLALRFGYRAWLGHLMVLGLLWTPLYRLPHGIMPHMHAMKFDITQVGVVQGMWNLILAGEADTVQLASAAGILIGVGLLWFLLYRLCRFLGRHLARERFGGGVLAVGALALGVAFVEHSLDPWRRSRFFSFSMLGATTRQVQHLESWAKFERRLAEQADKLDATPQSLARLQGADVILYFVESYGRSLFRHEKFGDAIRSCLQETYRELEAAGHDAASMWIQAPVSGALSQVSHSAMLSGVPVRSYRDQSRLLEQGVRMLPHVFRDVGYRSVNVQPKLEIDWPASRAKLGFDADFFGHHTPYRAEGTHYHWAPSPDQYLLAHCLHRYLKPDDPSAFLMFIGGISHAPFTMIPPYVDDWERARSAQAYLQPEKSYPFEFLTYHHAEGIEAAYMDTLRYTFRLLRGFVAALKRPAVVIVVGDHQAPLTGSIQPDVDDLTVPLHVLSNRPGLLEPLRKLPTVKGMVPKNPKVLPMHEFPYAFLRTYGER